MDDRLTSVIVLKLDAKGRELAFLHDFVALDPTFLLEDLGDLDLDGAEGAVDGDLPGLRTVTDAGQEVCNGVAVHSVITSST